MSIKKIQFKIKGHESFYIREGWLTKGIKSIENPYFFSTEYAVDKLGVGANMVKAIRYWLQATGLTNEKQGNKCKRKQELTNDFGEIIKKNDLYFEENSTLWLMHYKMSSNPKLCTTWYLFFNEFKAQEFTKIELIENMKFLMNKHTNNSNYSEKSLKDDCECLLKTYCYERYKDKNPEENILSIFNNLRILEKKKIKGQEVYTRTKPNTTILDKIIVYYVILDNLGNKTSTSIQEILDDNCNAGKTFNLDRNMLNQYLDLLLNDGYIDINRTAGLDKIYIKEKNKNPKDILEDYYKQL